MRVLDYRRTRQPGLGSGIGSVDASRPSFAVVAMRIPAMRDPFLFAADGSASESDPLGQVSR